MCAYLFCRSRNTYSDLICRYISNNAMIISMLGRIFPRPALSTTITWFRALSLTPVCCNQPPREVFRGSNWQPADTIRTDENPEPMGVPDDWDKYNRVVYPPTAPGETPRKGVIIKRLSEDDFPVFL